MCEIEKAKSGSLAVKKEIPDAEEFVFTGNFECVSMSREVMRTQTAHATSFDIIENILNTWLRLYHALFLASVVQSFLYFET